MSKGTQDFLIGVAVMVAIILVVIWISGDSWNSQTGWTNNGTLEAGYNCTQANAAGAGC